MAQQMMQNRNVQDYFIELTKSLGGNQCKAWTKIAKLLKQNFNYYVDKPETLKSIWKTLTNQVDKINKEQAKTLIFTYLESKNSPYEGHRQFEKITNNQVTYNFYRVQAEIELHRNIKELMSYLTRRKVSYKRPFLRSFQKSFRLMVFAQYAKTDDHDPILNEVKYYSSLLTQVLYTLTQYKGLKRPFIYEQLSKVVTRQQFEKIMFYWHYVHALYLLRLEYNLSIENMQLIIDWHPLLKKSVKENQECATYKVLLDQNDYQQKYHMFHSSEYIDKKEYELFLHEFHPNHPDRREIEKSKSHKMKNIQPQMKLLYQKTQNNTYKTIRGKLGNPGDYQYKGWKTIIFNNPEDDEDSNEVPNQDEIQKRLQMQRLYELAFGIDQ